MEVVIAGGVTRRVAPLACGCALAAAAVYVAANDPASGGIFLPCAFRQAAGLWCPGCGLTRGMHALLGGDVAGALAMNVFTPLAALLLVAAWWTWTARAFAIPGRPLLARVPGAWWVAVGVVAAAYGVLRNVPAGPLAALAP